MCPPTGTGISLLPGLMMVFMASLLISGCMSPGSSRGNRPDLSRKVVNYGQRVPKGGGHYKVGKPYQIANRWYRPRVNTHYDRVGIASWYGDLFHGRKTANGEVFDMDALTAAHPTLPLPTLVEVTNLENNRKIVVRVNDRGPYRHNRLIDLSRKAATVLGFKNKGTARVRVRYVGRAPLDGDDSLEKRVLAHNFSSGRSRTIGRYNPPPSDRFTGQSVSHTDRKGRSSGRDHTTGSQIFSFPYDDHLLPGE